MSVLLYTYSCIHTTKLLVICLFQSADHLLKCALHDSNPVVRREALDWYKEHPLVFVESDDILESIIK